MRSMMRGERKHDCAIEEGSGFCSVAAAVVGSAVVGGVMASDAQQSAVDTAAGAQVASTQAGIDANQRQFDAVRKLLEPYTLAGQRSLGMQGDLVGLNGNGPQQAAINALQTSPAFTSALKLGENRILQNASATGGLRGGNTQAALAQFAPQLLAQTINDQYGKLGGITSIGQNAAAGVGNAGMATGNSVAALLQQQGAAQAGAALAGGRATSNMVNSFTGGLGTFAGLGGFNRGSSNGFLESNSGVLNQGLTPADLYGAF